jgi:hypothetical protein
MNALRLGVTTDAAGEDAGLYLADAERAAHVYVIGSTGVGKSKAVATWALHDLRDGHGFGVIDPHGDLVHDIVANAVAFPEIRLIEFGAEEMVTLNPLERVPGVDVYTQTLELVDVFRKIWELSDATTPRLIEILRNAVWTLIEAGETLLELEPLLTDDGYRARLMRTVTHEGVARFWRNRFEQWPPRERALFVESTLNKASAFTADPRLRLMLGAKKSSLDVRALMDKRQILLVDLSKGVLRTNTNLIGALLLSRIQMAAVSRLGAPEAARIPWTLYVDEFQNYATESFAEILAEARKMGLRLVLANQTLAQLPDRLRAIILANTRNLVAFRCDRLDAELLVRYIGSINPQAIKHFDGERLYFSSAEEQWEQQIEELTTLPLRSAILRTKARAPRRFETLALTSPLERADQKREIIRDFGRELGWLRGVRELDEELAVRSLATAGAEVSAEPSDFWDSPRGSD